MATRFRAGLRQARLDQLHESPDNPRTIKDDRWEALGKALEDDPGMMRARPIVADLDGEIVCGHMRHRRLTHDGKTKAWTYFEDFSGPGGEARKREWKVRDNVDYGEWDDRGLADLTIAHQEAGGDLELLGPPIDELTDLLDARALEGAGEPEPEIPDPPARPTTRPGDTIRLGDHVLVCADARDPAAIAGALEGDRAEMIWTDPPYGVNLGPLAASRGRDHGDMVGDTDEPEQLRQLVTSVLSGCLDHAEPGGAIYLCHPDVAHQAGTLFREALADAGWQLRQVLIWIKNSLVLGRQDYQWRHEPILYGWAPGAGHRWHGHYSQTTVHDGERTSLERLTRGELQDLAELLINEQAGTIIRVDRPSVAEHHPTAKPVELVAAHLHNSSQPGDRILDPFAGSGSTLLAAETMGRRASLVEIDPGYCDVTIARWEAATGETAERPRRRRARAAA